jgi:SAM-dependent methyltransferase
MIAARDDGWLVVGTELHPDPPRRRGLEVVSHITELPDDATFDCVTFWHSLEHMPDPLNALQLAAARLKPTGVLIVAVPDNGGVQAKLFGRNWLHLDIPRHLYHFHRTSMTALLQTAGFRPVRWWSQEFEYDLMGLSQSCLTAIMPTPNVFYDAIAKRRSSAAPVESFINLVGGVVLSAIGTPVVWLTSALRKGGTLVVAAKPA